MWSHYYQAVWTAQLPRTEWSKPQPWTQSKWWKTPGEDQFPRLHCCCQARGQEVKNLRHFSRIFVAGLHPNYDPSLHPLVHLSMVRGFLGGDCLWYGWLRGQGGTRLSEASWRFLNQGRFCVVNVTIFVKHKERLMTPYLSAKWPNGLGWHKNITSRCPAPLNKQIEKFKVILIFDCVSCLTYCGSQQHDANSALNYWIW